MDDFLERVTVDLPLLRASDVDDIDAVEEKEEKIETNS